jgi:hypothetical protein
MEFIAGMALAAFIVFVAYRVKKGKENEGSGNSTGGGGTGNQTHHK